MAGLLSAAEVAGMRITVGIALDQSLPLLRKTAGEDDSGHATETWVSQGNVTCNVFSPTSTYLQQFAEIIGSQWAMMLRFLPGTDIREGDQITYQAKNWLVQNIQDSESYTIPNDALMTVIV